MMLQLLLLLLPPSLVSGSKVLHAAGPLFESVFKLGRHTTQLQLLCGSILRMSPLIIITGVLVLNYKYVRGHIIRKEEGEEEEVVVSITVVIFV